MKIRQPIVTVVGHVDHGKTSILDCFRGSSVQESESGGITQKISFTKYPLEQIKKACPIIEEQKVKLEIPGFLFIDTPGHQAFTNLRKRGGSLADLAILVISIKEGIKPQTQEVLQILKANKTPFLIALNKLDTISSWQTNNKSLQESIENQSINASQEFQEALLTFQASLQEHGFESDLFYNISDFTKKIAIVPCSARTKQGIQELLFVLCGLSQKYLKEKLQLSKEARGVLLEIKKDKSKETIESILYDGTLKEGDEIIIASFTEPIIAKVRSIEEILPLSNKYKSVKEVTAASGIRLQLTNKIGILPGMPFQQYSRETLQQVKEQFKKELSKAIQLDKSGIIIKADSLGSLEALITLLKQENIQIVKAGIGPINKSDIISAKANLENFPLDSIILGFNTSIEQGLESGKVKILTNNVIYKLIEELKLYRNNKQQEIEKARLLGLSTLCKLQILHQYKFRNSNPAVFGIRILAGKLKKGIPLIDQDDNEIARVKEMQLDKSSVEQAEENQELAISLPGTNFERQLEDKQFLYSNISESQFKNFLKNKDLLSSNEIKILKEIQLLKSKKNEHWGA